MRPQRLSPLWQVTLNNTQTHKPHFFQITAIKIMWVENSKVFWWCTDLCGGRGTGIRSFISLEAEDKKYTSVFYHY